ncbi:MAG: alpha-ribazole phosphatase family protein [Gammaproteobacteria bacterium]|nr:alpha-ribazole phosphatase family protein [Gammaproteobacteria bacterium]
MLIDFLRHGEPEGGRRYRGHGCDDPLTEKGWMQMRQAVAGQKPWSRIVSSPLIRCKAFAESFAQQEGLPWEVREDLKEVGFGCWEGRDRAELMADPEAGFDAFYADPVNCRPQGAEDLADFVVRVGAVMDDLQEEYQDEHLLVVAHAGVIRAAIAHVIGLSAKGMYQVKVGNAEFTRFELLKNKPNLLIFHGLKVL